MRPPLAPGARARDWLARRRAAPSVRSAVSLLSRPWALALGGFTAAFVAVTWPLLTRLSGATYGGPGDGWALIWQTWARHERGVHYLTTAVDPDLAWPFGTEYASAILLSNAVTELPNLLLLSLGVPDVAAYNLIVLIGVVASSMAMYGVVRRLGCRPAVAFFAGLAYMLAPWHLDRAAIHPTLALMVALPLLVLGVVEWSRAPTLRSGAIVVAAAILAAYGHVYYGLSALLVLVLGLPIALLAAASRRALREMVARTGLLAGVLALAALPLALALALQRSEVTTQVHRPLYLADLAAQTHLYLLPSVGNPLFGGLSRDYLEARGLPDNSGELALYLGWVTIALVAVALVALALGRAPRLAAAVAAAMAALGLVLSPPARITLPLVGETRTPVSYLNDVVDFISTPARFFALTLTGAVILAALGLQALARRLPDRRVAIGVVAALTAASAAELAIDPSGRIVSTAPPPIMAAVERHVPEGAPLAQYPSTDRSLRPVADQLFRQVRHGRPLLNGASVGTIEDLVRREVSEANDPANPGRLALLGYEWATFEPAAYAHVAGGINEAYGYVPPDGFETVEQTTDRAHLLRITAPPAAGLAVRGRSFHPEGGRIGFLWMDGPEAALLVCATASGSYELSSQGFAFAEDRRIRVGPRAQVSLPAAEEPRPFTVRVSLEPGWQWVPVRLVGSRPTRPADIVPGSNDFRRISVSLAGVTVRGPSGDPGPCRAGPLPPPGT